MPDDYATQISLKLGGGRPPELMANFRGDSDQSVVERFEAIAEAVVAQFRAAEAVFHTSAPAPSQEPTAPSVGQAVDNVVRAFPNAQPVQEPTAPPATPGRPGNGDIHPTKTCPDCGSNYRVVDRLKKDGQNRFRVLECPVNPKEHKKDWSENYRNGA